MKKKDKEFVNQCIGYEGFDYCFIDYSDFEQIKDEKFHELRKAYIQAHDDLIKYLGYEPQF